MRHDPDFQKPKTKEGPKPSFFSWGLRFRPLSYAVACYAVAIATIYRESVLNPEVNLHYVMPVYCVMAMVVIMYLLYQVADS